MLDYTKLLDVHSLKDKEVAKLKQDFLSQFEETLKSLQCDPEFIPTIGSTVFESMMSTRLHYHTPAHILNLFTVAKQNGITLKPTEELAILFHDAIYRPGSKENEEYSCVFMSSLMSNTNVNADHIGSARVIIYDTALHLRNDDAIHPDSLLVMDLDMSGFANSPGEFNSNSVLVEREFHRGYGNDIYTLEQFLTGRLKFLTALSERKSIFRTPFFLKKLEKRAQINLKNAIIEVKNRIESEL